MPANLSRRNSAKLQQQREFCAKKIAGYHQFHAVPMVKKFRDAAPRGVDLGMSEEEMEFYDALANKEAALLTLTDQTLKETAHKLTESLRQNLRVDWSERESVQAKLHLMVKASCGNTSTHRICKMGLWNWCFSRPR